MIAGAGVEAHELLPAVHRVASLAKRWLLGTHQGGVKPGHLPAYLDEFTFRFNRRCSRSRGLLFYRLLAQAVAAGPRSYRSLVVGHPSRRLTMPEPPFERRVTGDLPTAVHGDRPSRRDLALREVYCTEMEDQLAQYVGWKSSTAYKIDGELVDGTVLVKFWRDLTVPDGKLDVQPKLVAKVVFEETSAVGRMEVYDAFRGMGGAVQQIIGDPEAYL